MKTINEYSESIKKIIDNKADKNKLHNECCELVLMYGRRGGLLAYEMLSDSLQDELSAHTLENILDVLDALSGQCHPKCRIGSGTYHLNTRPSEILSNKKNQIINIISKYPVKNALVFGSVARGEDTKESDLDIMVEPLDNCSLFHLGGLYEELVEELGIEISLCTSKTMIQRFGASILNDTIALKKTF